MRRGNNGWLALLLTTRARPAAAQPTGPDTARRPHIKPSIGPAGARATALSSKLRFWTLGLGGIPLIAWALWSMSPFQATRPSPNQSAIQFRRHLDARVPALISRFGVPGVSVATVAHGRPGEAFAYGLADVASRRPMTEDTVFEVASISKSFTAWGVVQLAQSGRLSLDAPVETYLDRWPLARARYPSREVTVRRLLQHVAGVSPGNLGVRRPEEPGLSTLALLRGEGRNLEVQTAGQARLVQPANRGFLYSNPGYLLLQLAVEQRTGDPFKRYMKREVLQPLGMTSSSFEWDPGLRARTSTPYLSDGRPDVITIPDAATDGSLFTTAPDLARFMAAELQPAAATPAPRGRLTAASLVELFDGRVPLPWTQVQGMGSDRGALGHYVERLPDGRAAIMNGGFFPGWTSQFYIVPATGDGIAVLTNSDRGRAVIAEIIADWSAWRGLPPFKMTRTYGTVALSGPLVVVGLGLAALWMFTDVLADLLERRARSAQRIWLTAIGCLSLAGGIGYVWFGLARMTLKFAFPWLDAPLTAAILALIVGLTFRAALPGPVTSAPALAPIDKIEDRKEVRV
jgi:CubicO group peptidase (beta-lactamase class C family)